MMKKGFGEWGSICGSSTRSLASSGLDLLMGSGLDASVGVMYWISD